MVAEKIPVSLACRVLAVSESGYYERLKRVPSERAVRHAWLTDLIKQVHIEARGTYGARRVHAELTLGRGIVVGHGQVELLMQRAGISGVTGRPKWKRNKPDSIASDKVDRVFGRTGPNQLWVTDITEHPTREGKVYCCVVLDTYSRRVVGWSIDASPTAALVTNALGMAIDSRLGKTSSAETVIHSDQGVQFGSWAFTDRAKAFGLVPSMGSVGDCYDNSMIESIVRVLREQVCRSPRPPTAARLKVNHPVATRPSAKLSSATQFVTSLGPPMPAVRVLTPQGSTGRRRKMTACAAHTEDLDRYPPRHGVTRVTMELGRITDAIGCAIGCRWRY